FLVPLDSGPAAVPDTPVIEYSTGSFAEFITQMDEAAPGDDEPNVAAAPLDSGSDQQEWEPGRADNDAAAPAGPLTAAAPPPLTDPQRRPGPSPAEPLTAVPQFYAAPPPAPPAAPPVPPAPVVPPGHLPAPATPMRETAAPAWPTSSPPAPTQAGPTQP